MWTAYKHDHFHIKWAESGWEKEQAYRIRRAVFCDEQGLFKEHDTDDVDLKAQTLVAVQQLAGMPERVVGTVRIYESAPRIWWGSRLAVEPDFRRQGVLGAGLIKLAVRSANSLGCDEFHATVQAQNETLFKRLHWHPTDHLMIQGVDHVKMVADLAHYPPMDCPQQGFWQEGKRHKSEFTAAILEGLPSISSVTRGGLWN